MCLEETVEGDASGLQDSLDCNSKEKEGEGLLELHLEFNHHNKVCCCCCWLLLLKLVVTEILSDASSEQDSSGHSSFFLCAVLGDSGLYSKTQTGLKRH
jgi:hypothetical protein